MMLTTSFSGKTVASNSKDTKQSAGKGEGKKMGWDQGQGPGAGSRRKLLVERGPFAEIKEV